MTMSDDIPALFAYTRWADQRMLEAVRKLAPEQFVQEPAPGWTSVRSSLFHLGAVMVVWARGLAGEEYGTFPAEADYATVERRAASLAGP
jgi:uncharacterized damage-inducible protein DinB